MLRNELQFRNLELVNEEPKTTEAEFDRAESKHIEYLVEASNSNCTNQMIAAYMVMQDLLSLESIPGLYFLISFLLYFTSCGWVLGAFSKLVPIKDSKGIFFLYFYYLFL